MLGESLEGVVVNVSGSDICNGGCVFSGRGQQ